MDANTFRHAMASSAEHAIDYFATVGERPVVSTVQPGYLRTRLPASAPETPESWDAIHRDIERNIAPGITHWQSPNFFAFFPCPATYASILGDVYSATYGGAGFNWICSPAATELETIVLDWLAQLLNLPREYLSTGPTHGGGVIHGSASEAVLTMMTAAADKYLRAVLAADHPGFDQMSAGDQEDLRAARRSRLVALGGATAHSSARKAAQVLGLRYRSVPAPVADGYRMTGASLKDALAKVRAAGLEPFFVATTFGTTDTCAVDDFDSIAGVLAEYRAAETAAGRPDDAADLWVHVDGAHAGSALVVPEQRGRMSASGTAVLARFHSFNLNMHKWLLVNFDCSVVFVRDRAYLRNALGADAHYYKNDYSDNGLVTDYRDWQLPLGRRFRSLKVWFVLRTHGAAGLRAYIRKGVQLGEHFAAGIAQRSDLFEIITGPRFTLTVFRCATRAGESVDDTTARTRRVCDAVNRHGTIWVTGTTLDGGVAAIRVMTANYATEQEHVDRALEIIIAAAEAQQST